MHPGVGSRVTVPQAIGSGSRSSQDHPRVARLSHETKEYFENLCMKATIDQFILVARNYPVAIVAIICLCRLAVNGFNRIARSVAIRGLSFWVLPSGELQRTLRV
jgi:hypothetical protein